MAKPNRPRFRRAALSVLRLIGRPGHLDTETYDALIARSHVRTDALRLIDDRDLRAKLPLSTRGASAWSVDELELFVAVTVVAAERTLDLTPFDTQLAAALVVAQGAVVEMDTGEGKTLVGGLAALAHASRGRHVTVVSVNDYLAGRDAELVGPLLAFFGFSTAAIGDRSGPGARAAAYDADVTYVAVHELGFDVLRDRLRAPDDERVLPPRDVVIIDEADAVMIDEATVPLVLAGPLGAPVDIARVSTEIGLLNPEEHFELDTGSRHVGLTDVGIAALESSLGVDNLFDLENVELLTQVNVALYARVLLERDVDYIVRDQRIEIVNASRGRVGLLHRWPDGLQAAVEAKEGLPPGRVGQVLDSITVEDLLGGFRLISGMTGTALPVASEIEEFYGAQVGRVERDSPDRREDLAPRVFATIVEKDAALLAHVRAAHLVGQPVLIGTQSVIESEQLAGRLLAAGLKPQVLNARNDAAEAEIVARAGDPGQITISTQMAGRGTDIRLGHDSDSRKAVIAVGGLAVVATSAHGTRRLDRQLRGRAGRQGDPGSSVVFLSFEDDLIARFLPPHLRPRLSDGSILGNTRRERRMIEACQRAAEGMQLSAHRATWLYDKPVTKQRDEVLATRERLIGGGAVDELVGALDPRWRADGDIVRHCSVAALDQAWREHLGVLAEARDGIYLRSLGGDHPVDAFTKIALAEFDGFFERARRLAVEMIELALVDGLTEDTLNRPSSTWTYMSDDDPFGSSGDRLVQNFGRLVQGRRQ